MISLILKKIIEELKDLLTNQLKKIVSKSNKSVTQISHDETPVTIQFFIDNLPW